MLNKINLPILVTVMCALIMLVLGLEMANRGYFNQKPKTNKTAEVTITRTDYSKAARKTLDWIDQQRNDKGWYILERGCDYETKTCDTVWDNEEGNKDGLIATWARLNFYEQTKDKKDLDIVKSDIDKFYEKYQDDNLNNSLWICKITYEMAQSKYLPDETKTKLKELCFKTEYPTTEEIETYWKQTRSEKLSKANKENQGWKNWEGYSLALRGFDASLGYSTDLLSKYQWSKDKNYLTIANSYLETVEKIFEEEKITNLDNICLLGVSYLDMYRQTKNNDSLEKVTAIYNKYIENETDKKKIKTVMCGLMVKRLYQATKEVKFLAELESNNKVATSLYLDGGNLQILSDYGVFTPIDGEITVLFKKIIGNALMVDLIKN